MGTNTSVHTSVENLMDQESTNGALDLFSRENSIKVKGKEEELGSSPTAMFIKGITKTILNKALEFTSGQIKILTLANISTT